MDDACVSRRIGNSSIELITNSQLTQKQSKLISLAKSVMHDSRHRVEVQSLMLMLGVNESEIIQDFVHYNLDLSAFGNEIYESLAMRFVLYIHDLLENSWHQERQAVVSEFVNMTLASSIADIGFGEPTLYVKEALRARRPKITLCDYEQSAFTFAEALLEIWDLRWRDVVSFKQTDMDTNDFVGSFDAYIFKDSLPHTSDPAFYLDSYVKKSPPHAQFILSLPIGPIIPAHYMAWSTKEEVISWLDLCGLKVKEQREVHVNPDVDLFAEGFDYKFYDLIVLCQKKV